MSLFGPPNIKKLMAQKNFDALVRAIEHRNPEIGREAIQALAEIPNTRAVEALAAVLKNNMDFHEAALRSLVKIGISSSSTLLSSLKNLDYDKEILSQVIPELVKAIHIEEAEEGLLVEAMHSGDWAQKWRAAEILGRRRCDKAICFLKASLVDKAWQVRLQAAKVLGEIGDQGAIEPLTERLRDENRSVRTASLESLIQLNAINDPIIEMLLASRSWDELARIGAPVLGILLNALEKLELNDSDAYELARAITKLGKKGIEALIDYVKEKSGQGPDCSFIYEALIHSGEEAREALMELMMSEPDASRNASIIRGLGQVLRAEEIEVVALMTESLEDKNRAAAVSALGQLRDRHLVDVIRPLLQDQSYEVRKEASQALKNFDVEELIKSYVSLSETPNERTMKIFIQALEDSSHPLRWKIAELLGLMKCDASVEALAGVLNDNDMYVRFKAIKSLGMIGTGEAIRILLGCLDHRHQDVAATSAQVLGNLGNVRVLDPLLKCIERGNKTTSIINALGMLKENKAVRSLARLLHDDDWQIRTEAKIALMRIGTPSAFEALKNFKDEGQFYMGYLCDGPCLFRTERELAMAIVDELRDPLIQGLLILPSNEKSEPYFSCLERELPDRYVHLSVKTDVSEKKIKQIYLSNFGDVASIDIGYDALEEIHVPKNVLRAKIFLVNPQLEGLQGFGLDPVIRGLKYITGKYYEEVPVSWHFSVNLGNALEFLNSAEKLELRERGSLTANVAHRILLNR